jgi:hypothetical protein
MGRPAESMRANVCRSGGPDIDATPPAICGKVAGVLGGVRPMIEET